MCDNRPSLSSLSNNFGSLAQSIQMNRDGLGSTKEHMLHDDHFI